MAQLSLNRLPETVTVIPQSAWEQKPCSQKAEYLGRPVVKTPLIMTMLGGYIMQWERACVLTDTDYEELNGVNV